MKIYSTLINYAFNFVIKTSKQYNIDDSHSLRHSMEVFQFANQIYNNELINNPCLLNQKNIVMCSAILHDMCDKKYLDEDEGIRNLNEQFKDLLPEEELSVVNQIISSMSYSTVKKVGYPDLNMYNSAYHIVREADLLAAYDVERCIMYQMFNKDSDYQFSLNYVNELFQNRVLKYIDDNLFVNEYSKNLAFKLHDNSVKKLEEINNIYFDLN